MALREIVIKLIQQSRRQENSNGFSMDLLGLTERGSFPFTLLIQREVLVQP